MKIKTINDFVDQVHDKFPKLTKEQVKRIIQYGWRALYIRKYVGCDVSIMSEYINCYFGNLYKNVFLQYKHYVNKLRRKIKLSYRIKKIPWDGYYYFGMGQKEYDSIFQRMGRPRKQFTVHNKVFFRIKEEAEVNGALYYRYLFRTKSSVYRGETFYLEERKIDNFEFLGEIDKKWADILISNKIYETL